MISFSAHFDAAVHSKHVVPWSGGAVLKCAPEHVLATGEEVYLQPGAGGSHSGSVQQSRGMLDKTGNGFVSLVSSDYVVDPQSIYVRPRGENITCLATTQITATTATTITNVGTPPRAFGSSTVVVNSLTPLKCAGRVSMRGTGWCMSGAAMPTRSASAETGGEIVAVPLTVVVDVITAKTTAFASC